MKLDHEPVASDRGAAASVAQPECRVRLRQCRNTGAPERASGSAPATTRLPGGPNPADACGWIHAIGEQSLIRPSPGYAHGPKRSFAVETNASYASERSASGTRRYQCPGVSSGNAIAGAAAVPGA